jgi:hypothetical protein
MDKPRSFSPIIAAVLLLLPVLYVGSYLALVVPGGFDATPPIPRGTVAVPTTATELRRARFQTRSGVQQIVIHRYRLGGRRAEWFFWPLEQIDRLLRPGAWELSGLPYFAGERHNP